MDSVTSPVCLGVILGAFGVHGEVRVKSFCQIPENITAYGDVFSESGQKFHLHSVRTIKDGIAVRIDGVQSREDAIALKNTQLFANRGDLPDLELDDFYHSDLIGLAVVGQDGTALGHIIAVHNYGAGDILEVQPQTATKENSVLLPFSHAVVLVVDIAKGQIVIDTPDGLF